MYYLRTKAAASAIQFTVDKTKLKASNEANAEKRKVAAASKKALDSEESSVDGQDILEVEQNMAALMCSLQNKDDCMMCGS